MLPTSPTDSDEIAGRGLRAGMTSKAAGGAGGGAPGVGGWAAAGGGSTSAGPPGGQYRYLIFLGNNSDLVRSTLQRRPWWKSAIEDEDKATGALSPSLYLLGSSLGGGKQLDFFKHKSLCEEGLLSNNWDFTWKPTLGMKLLSGEVVTLHTVPLPPGGVTADGGLRQTVNHFPKVRCIAAKNDLLRGLAEYYWRVGITLFEQVPTTFLLRDIMGTGAAEYGRFCQHFRKLAMGQIEEAGEKMPKKHCRANLWIVKPSFLNQGKGIKVYSELTAIKEHLFSVERDGLEVDGAAVAAGDEWVVQKYLERPLLLAGRKFDIRVWVTVTDPSSFFNVYVYQDAYIRTSSEMYTIESDNKRSRGGDAATMIHLTNYCMQKHSKNLGQFEEGNTLSLEQLQTYLDYAFGPGKVSVRKDLFPRMKELILDTVLSNRDKLPEGGRGRQSFEFFGFDFMLDEDLRCTCIECNTCPFMCQQTPWHGKLLDRMMEDMVRLTVDRAYPPPPGHSMKEVAPLPEEVYAEAFLHKIPWLKAATGGAGGEGEQPDPPPYRDPRENGWELLYTEDPSVNPLDIPHQALVADKSMNKAVVEAAWRQVQEGKGPLTIQQVQELGLPQLGIPTPPGALPLHYAGSTAAGTAVAAAPSIFSSASAASVAAGRDQQPSQPSAPVFPKSLGPFTRRYIRCRDPEWNYPMGAAAALASDTLEEGAGEGEGAEGAGAGFAGSRYAGRLSKRPGQLKRSKSSASLTGAGSKSGNGSSSGVGAREGKEGGEEGPTGRSSHKLPAVSSTHSSSTGTGKPFSSPSRRGAAAAAAAAAESKFADNESPASSRPVSRGAASSAGEEESAIEAEDEGASNRLGGRNKGGKATLRQGARKGAADAAGRMLIPLSPVLESQSSPLLQLGRTPLSRRRLQESNSRRSLRLSGDFTLDDERKEGEEEEGEGEGDQGHAGGSNGSGTSAHRSSSEAGASTSTPSRKLGKSVNSSSSGKGFFSPLVDRSSSSNNLAALAASDPLQAAAGLRTTEKVQWALTQLRAVMQLLQVPLAMEEGAGLPFSLPSLQWSSSSSSSGSASNAATDSSASFNTAAFIRTPCCSANTSPSSSSDLRRIVSTASKLLLSACEGDAAACSFRFVVEGGLPVVWSYLLPVHFSSNSGLSSSASSPAPHSAVSEQLASSFCDRQHSLQALLLVLTPRSRASLEQTLRLCMSSYRKDGRARAQAPVPPLSELKLLLSPELLSPWLGFQQLLDAKLQQQGGAGRGAGAAGGGEESLEAAIAGEEEEEAAEAAAEAGGEEGLSAAAYSLSTLQPAPSSAAAAPPSSASLEDLLDLSKIPLPDAVAALPFPMLDSSVLEWMQAVVAAGSGLGGGAAAAAATNAAAGLSQLLRLKTSVLHNLQASWTTNAATSEVTVSLQLLSLRVMSHLLATCKQVAAGAGKGAAVGRAAAAGGMGAAASGTGEGEEEENATTTPLPAAGAAGGLTPSSTEAMTPEQAQELRRRKLAPAGVLACIAAQAAVASGESRRASREYLTLLSMQELRNVSRSLLKMAPALALAARSDSPGPLLAAASAFRLLPSFPSVTALVVSLAGLSRELSVKGGTGGGAAGGGAVSGKAGIAATGAGSSKAGMPSTAYWLCGGASSGSELMGGGSDNGAGGNSLSPQKARAAAGQAQAQKQRTAAAAARNGKAAGAGSSSSGPPSLPTGPLSGSSQKVQQGAASGAASGHKGQASGTRGGGGGGGGSGRGSTPPSRHQLSSRGSLALSHAGSTTADMRGGERSASRASGHSPHNPTTTTSSTSSRGRGAGNSRAGADASLFPSSAGEHTGLEDELGEEGGGEEAATLRHPPQDEMRLPDQSDISMPPSRGSASSAGGCGPVDGSPISVSGRSARQRKSRHSSSGELGGQADSALDSSADFGGSHSETNAAIRMLALASKQAAAAAAVGAGGGARREPAGGRQGATAAIASTTSRKAGSTITGAGSKGTGRQPSHSSKATASAGGASSGGGMLSDEEFLRYKSRLKELRASRSSITGSFAVSSGRKGQQSSSSSWANGMFTAAAGPGQQQQYKGQHLHFSSLEGGDSSAEASSDSNADSSRPSSDMTDTDGRGKAGHGASLPRRAGVGAESSDADGDGSWLEQDSYHAGPAASNHLQQDSDASDADAAADATGGGGGGGGTARTGFGASYGHSHPSGMGLSSAEASEAEEQGLPYPHHPAAGVGGGAGGSLSPKASWRKSEGSGISGSKGEGASALPRISSWHAGSSSSKLASFGSFLQPTLSQQQQQQQQLDFERWQKRKEEAARLEKERVEAQRAAIESEKAEKERQRLEKMELYRRKLAAHKAREAARQAEANRLLQLRRLEAQAASAAKAEVMKQREAGWVGISSKQAAAAAAAAGMAMAGPSMYASGSMDALSAGVKMPFYQASGAQQAFLFQQQLQLQQQFQSGYYSSGTESGGMLLHSDKSNAEAAGYGHGSAGGAGGDGMEGMGTARAAIWQARETVGSRGGGGTAAGGMGMGESYSNSSQPRLGTAMSAARSIGSLSHSHGPLSSSGDFSTSGAGVLGVVSISMTTGVNGGIGMASPFSLAHLAQGGSSHGLSEYGSHPPRTALPAGSTLAAATGAPSISGSASASGGMPGLPRPLSRVGY